MTTYVFNSVEVKLTGRTASKQIEIVKRRPASRTMVEQTLHEITPSNSEDGSWKKWVVLEELFTIKDKDEPRLP